MLSITAADLARLAPHKDIVEALREGFRGNYKTPLRHHHDMERPGAATLLFLLMPAWADLAASGRDAKRYAGLKTVMVTPDNSHKGLPTIQATYQLFSLDTGSPIALIDGSELTLRRTASASALAADYLARKNAADLVVVGTGELGPHLVRAHAAVRSIKKVHLFSRTQSKVAKAAAELGKEGFDVDTPSDLEAAVRNADIVSCATTAETPVVFGKWLRPGIHVDLVGAYRPTIREADGEAVKRSSVFVDTREGALSEAGDIVLAIKEGNFSPDRIKADFFELCRGAHKGRTSDDEITLFKSCGTAIEDLATAIMIYERAKKG